MRADGRMTALRPVSHGDRATDGAGEPGLSADEAAGGAGRFAHGLEVADRGVARGGPVARRRTTGSAGRSGGPISRRLARASINLRVH